MTSQSSTGDKALWVVVADRSKAIVYARDALRSPLRELFSLDNEAAQKKTDELITDRGGRSFDSHGKGRHTMSHEKADPKQVAAMAFAKQIAGRIAKALHEGDCRGFALVAAPGFLGLLRPAISITTTTEPYATIDKEVVGQDAAVIEKLLASI